MLFRVYRLNDIMIHDNDNCADACGMATNIELQYSEMAPWCNGAKPSREFFIKGSF